MSWMKRPQGAPAPAPAAPHQPYGAPQPFANQQNQFQNYSSSGTINPQAQPPQQYWQIPQQQELQEQRHYNQQYSQNYQQQGYGNNANQMYQQPSQYLQNTTNQGITNTQQGYQQNFYHHQGTQPQNHPHSQKNTDNWEESWGDWGWEESKQAQNKVAQNTIPAQVQSSQAVFSNANVIDDSFTSTNTWNWSAENQNEVKQTSLTQDVKELSPAPVKPSVSEQIQVNNVNLQRSIVNPSIQQSTEEVRTLNDKDLVKERLPNLALGKRFNLENLTPQWSIESQMSQESSDGPHTHSESTYRSENQSRNSSKSSPGLNTENSNFNYSQSGLDEMHQLTNEWSQLSNEEPTLVENSESTELRHESHDALSHSFQEMNITNCENPTPVVSTRNDSEPNHFETNSVSLPPPPSLSPTNYPPSVSPNISLSSSSMAVLSPPPTSSILSPSSVGSATLPPTTFQPSSSSQNPFKHAGPFSHKVKSSSTLPTPNQHYPTQMGNTNLVSPAAVTKVSQQSRVSVGYGANLETTPDNSERPDQPQMSNYMPMPVAQHEPDNLEVAPQNDRNEYLQTAHLSTGDYGDNSDFSRNAPPPGLRRMVVGQQEAEYNQSINISGDEPPPGLARMVPGQQTETDNSYNQSSENYMDRHIDGRPTDANGRPYRQADGQLTSSNYSQPPSGRGNDRRLVGFDRMVPGEPSTGEYSQYQSSFVANNDHRVIPGLDHGYSLSSDAGPTDIREQNMDGSDYTEQTIRNASRNIVGARDTINSVTPDYNPPSDDQQREIIMEGENLQDLSIVSSTDLSFSREQTLDGANISNVVSNAERISDSMEHLASSSRRQSLSRNITSGEDSERDRTFKSSPRRDRDKHKSTKDRDRERDRDKDRDGRYSRDEKKYDRDSDKRSRGDRRYDRDRKDRDKDKERSRRDRDDSPDERSHRRSTRGHRYQEDTDYYSDRERERGRSYREGSYSTSKPPRPDAKERSYRDERDRNRRYNTIERERYDRDDERDRRRRRDKYEGKYRDIDPSRKYGNLRMEKEDEERRRVVTFSGDSKTSDKSRNEGEEYSPGSRAGTEDELPDAEARRRPRHARHAHAREPYYDGYGGSGSGGGGGGVYADPYLAQRQQYQYYEHLRLTDPAAYMQVYKQVMAGHAPAPHHQYAAALQARAPPYDGFIPASYDRRGEDRGSVHSGRSSANGLKTDTWYMSGVGAGLRATRAPSLRTDCSDRYTDLNTDASLNLHLEESTVRSERMTPFKYATAHIKGSVAARHAVVVRASYPADGRAARVLVLALRQPSHDFADYPGPLVKGVTHKKSVMEYCAARVREAGRRAPADVIGYVLVWELLALLLRQNGVVVGSDIAELLMKNTREYDFKLYSGKNVPQSGSPRGSSCSGERAGETSSPEEPSASDLTPHDEPSAAVPEASEGAEKDERAALDRLREYLIYGNRQQAIEWAVSTKLWGHALQLAAHGTRRERAAVAARFVAAVPRNDPLHTLYAALAGTTPPAATYVSSEWRAHAAMILSNAGEHAERSRVSLSALGDALRARGLPHSAHFCYVAGGGALAPHPLAPLPPAPLAPAAVPATPPRLALLLADSRSHTLDDFATNEAIFATEIYEYALSLNQDYVINELQVYKFLLGVRLVDLGEHGRALRYLEACARGVQRCGGALGPALPAAVAALADRLRYHDPDDLGDPDDPDDPDDKRNHRWIEDIKHFASQLQEEAASRHSSPQRAPHAQPAEHAHYEPHTQHVEHAEDTYTHQQYSWSDQTLNQQQQYQPVQMYSTEQAEETAAVAPPPDYGGYYQPPPPEPAELPDHPAHPVDDAPPSYGDNYWQHDNTYGYGEAAPVEERPVITMPGTRAPRALRGGGTAQDHLSERENDAPTGPVGGPEPGDGDGAGPGEAAGKGDARPKEEARKGGGWFGSLFSKLRPPNQMNLPDDKNPTIVWDAEHKRWRDLASDAPPAPAAPPPPPLVPNASPGAPAVNMFKMPNRRNIKQSYVDVFNPGGGRGGAGGASVPPPPAAPALPPPQGYLVPGAAPLHQSGAYEPLER